MKTGSWKAVGGSIATIGFGLTFLGCFFSDGTDVRPYIVIERLQREKRWAMIDIAQER